MVCYFPAKNLVHHPRVYEVVTVEGAFDDPHSSALLPKRVPLVFVQLVGACNGLGEIHGIGVVGLEGWTPF